MRAGHPTRIVLSGLAGPNERRRRRIELRHCAPEPTLLCSQETLFLARTMSIDQLIVYIYRSYGSQSSVMLAQREPFCAPNAALDRTR